MRNLIVHEFISLDGVVQAPGGKDEDRDGGFAYGGRTLPHLHQHIGVAFFQAMQNVDAFLLGRRTYEIHAGAFEPMKPGDPFGDLMNAPKKYVVSRTLKQPIWRDTTIIRDNPVEAVRSLKNQPGKDIMSDGSSQLIPLLLQHDLIDQLHLTPYPLTLGGGKRTLPQGPPRKFRLLSAKPYPTGVVALHYARQ